MTPLVPAEVDLSDFKFMPLDCVRLRDSDLTSNVSGDEFRCAVLLWCASWHQIPAASLPNDDKVLSNFSGFGRVVKEWLKVKDGAMRGWLLCNDGRLYHPVVAEKALEAWRSKLEQRWKTECARIKKHNQRHNLNLRCPEFEEWTAIGCPQGQPLPVPKDSGTLSQGQPPVVPRETPSKGQGRDREGIVKEEKKEKGARKRAPSFNAAEIELPEWLDRDDWQRWCADRRTRGKAVTEEAARLQIGKLASYMEHGTPPKVVIDHSILNGYQGLFAPKKESAAPALQSFRERDAEAAKEAGRRWMGSCAPNTPDSNVIDMEEVNARLSMG